MRLADLARPRVLWGVAFTVSLVATLGSLNFSGIGPLGWRGMGLFPCELCWYQRILMYPLPVLIGVGLWQRIPQLPLLVLPLAMLGVGVAGYHTALQLDPGLEAGQCFVGSCASVDWVFLGTFTIPQLSLLAFLLVTVLVASPLVLAPMVPADTEGTGA